MVHNDKIQQVGLSREQLKHAEFLDQFIKEQVQRGKLVLESGPWEEALASSSSVDPNDNQA